MEKAESMKRALMIVLDILLFELVMFVCILTAILCAMWSPVWLTLFILEPFLLAGIVKITEDVVTEYLEESSIEE